MHYSSVCGCYSLLQIILIHPHVQDANATCFVSKVLCLDVKDARYFFTNDRRNIRNIFSNKSFGAQIPEK